MPTFTILSVVLIGAIVYFHYVQGFLSATLSAVIAIVAAAMAISYHENLVNSFEPVKSAEYAHAVVLVFLFAIVYIVLRCIFDYCVPGNIRLPFLVDKIGAAVMGLVAAIFAVGILAVAIQTLPFGPTIAGYSRYAMSAIRECEIAPGIAAPNAKDAAIGDRLEELKDDTFDEKSRNSLFIPVDDFVISTVASLSNGPLAGHRPIASIHPDLLQELFGARLGLQLGAVRVARNASKQADIRVTGVARLNDVKTCDLVLPAIRQSPLKLEPLSANDMLLAVRITVSSQAADSDGFFRFSPAGIRLVAPREGELVKKWRNHYPVGVLADDKLALCRIDDPMFLDLRGTDRAIDLVFKVDQVDIINPEKDNTGESKPFAVRNGVFLEVKRMAAVGLAGIAIEPTPKDTKGLKYGVVLMRTKPPERPAPPPPPTIAAIPPTSVPVPRPAPRPAPPVPAPPVPVPQPTRSSPFVCQKVVVSDKFDLAIGLNTPARNIESVEIAGGTARLKDRKFAAVLMDTIQSTDTIQKGDYQLFNLYTDRDQTIVQVVGAPPVATGADAWIWAAKLPEIQLHDGSGAPHKPVGFCVKFKAKAGESLLIRYKFDGDLPAAIAPLDAHVVEVRLFFPFPLNSAPTRLSLSGQQVPLP